jgi:hypothetical protein
LARQSQLPSQTREGHCKIKSTAKKCGRPKTTHIVKPTNIPNSEGGRDTSVPEGEKANTQDKEQNYPPPQTEGEQGTIVPKQDQPDLVVPGLLQHKLSCNLSSQLCKKLKPGQIVQISNDLKTPQGSGIDRQLFLN